MKNLVKLNVQGVSDSQSQSMAYALILKEEDGKRSLPIIIGPAEAQSIVMHIEHLTPQRPLTHDLIFSIMDAFQTKLKSVLIYKSEGDIFCSELLLMDKSGQEIKIDSRTSDAIAIAIRTQSPIYTTEELMKESSVLFSDLENNYDKLDFDSDFDVFLDNEMNDISEFLFDDDDEDLFDEELDETDAFDLDNNLEKIILDEIDDYKHTEPEIVDIEQLPLHTLNKMLDIAIKNEDYEKALIYRDEIKKRGLR